MLLTPRIQQQLNRGESRHDLVRWIFFAQQGAFQIGDYDEIMNKVSALSLLSNAILVWNTIAIARIVATLRTKHPQLLDDHLARVSPLSYRHVIPNGTYHFLPSSEGDDIA